MKDEQVKNLSIVSFKYGQSIREITLTKTTTKRTDQIILYLNLNLKETFEYFSKIEQYVTNACFLIENVSHINEYVH